MSFSIPGVRGQGRAQRGRRPLDMLGLFLRVSSSAKRVSLRYSLDCFETVVLLNALPVPLLRQVQGRNKTSHAK